MIRKHKSVLFLSTSCIFICIMLYVYTCNGTSCNNIQHFNIDDVLTNSMKNYARIHNLFHTVNVTEVNLVPNTILPTIVWSDQREGINFSNYGDKTCGDNPDRKILRIILQRWIELSRLANISYFISTGTLLGSWRNGDIIPYDSDLDVMIDSRDNKKLDKLKDIRNFTESDNKFHLILQEDWKLEYKKRRRFKCNGKKVEEYSDECSFQEPLGRLIKGNRHLDIYDYTVRNDTVYDPSEWEKTYPLNDIVPLRYCKFMGYTTFCPNKPLTILKAFYGDKLLPNTVCKNGEWIDI